MLREKRDYKLGKFSIPKFVENFITEIFSIVFPSSLTIKNHFKIHLSAERAKIFMKND